MVKNKKGGSRHKKMGRKYVSNNFENVKLVKSSNEYEIYACVTKSKTITILNIYIYIYTSNI